MANSDNYEFEKSNIAQSRDSYSPYVEKQWNYVNDLNNSVYNNNSLSLVQFDLGQIFNSNTLSDSADLFLVIPITIVAACRTASALVSTASPGASSLCSIKQNYSHLIHSADIQLGSKTLESNQPYLNILKHFNMLSNMNLNDLATIGPTLGFANTLDATRSMRYVSGNTATTAASGNGPTNNRPYGTGDHQSALVSSQNDGACNPALFNKINRFIDTSSNSNNILSLVTVTQLNKEFRPYYEFKSGYHVWYDYGVIRLADVFESMANIGLIQRMDCNLRLYLNTGCVNISVGGTLNDNTSMSYFLPSGQSSFTNTCPLMVHYLATSATSVATIPSTTTGIVAGLFIAKPPTTSYNGINLASSNASHPLQNCRIYYSQITVKPDLLLEYLSNNTEKKVSYRSFITSFTPNIAANGSYSGIISAGITHVTSVLIIPYIANSSTSGLMNYQWASPFDTCPATAGSGVSLTDLQVSIGGKNQLQTTLSYNYDNFIQQVNNAEQLISAQDYGLSNGLFSQQWWESSKYYYINCERSLSADKLVPKNINISYTNNSNVAVDVLVFVQYSSEVTIDVRTGAVTQ